jgi:hypothetical protein
LIVGAKGSWMAIPLLLLIFLYIQKKYYVHFYKNRQ